MRPIGASLCSSTARCDATITHAPPSVTCELLPAVTLPYLRSKNGFSLARFSDRRVRAHAVVRRVHGAALVVERHDLVRRSAPRAARRARARGCFAAYSSMSRRVMPKRYARFSAVCPISRPQIGSVRPFISAMTGAKYAGRNFASSAARWPAGLRRVPLRQPVHHRVGKEQRRARQRVDAARQHQVRAPRADVVDGRVDRLHAGRAVAHHGPAGHLEAAAHPQRGDPADVDLVRRRRGAAQDHLVELLAARTAAAAAARGPRPSRGRTRQTVPACCAP